MPSRPNANGARRLRWPSRAWNRGGASRRGRTRAPDTILGGDTAFRDFCDAGDTRSTRGRVSKTVLWAHRKRYPRKHVCKVAERPLIAVYALRSLVHDNIGCTYVGYTVDSLKKRLQRHNGDYQGGARETKRLGPWRVMCFVHGFCSQRHAREYESRWQYPKSWPPEGERLWSRVKRMSIPDAGMCAEHFETLTLGREMLTSEYIRRMQRNCVCNLSFAVLPVARTKEEAYAVVDGAQARVVRHGARPTVTYTSE